MLRHLKMEIKDGDEDKNNKLMSFRIDHVKLYALPVFDDR